MRTILLATTLSLLLVSGCASAGGRAGGSGNPDVITSATLDDELPDNPTLYDVVQRLRPNWLRARNSAGVSGGLKLPVVLMNGARYGALGTLRNLHVNDVRQLRFVNARDATTKYGTGYAGGAIELTSR